MVFKVIAEQRLGNLVFHVVILDYNIIYIYLLIIQFNLFSRLPLCDPANLYALVYVLPWQAEFYYYSTQVILSLLIFYLQQ